jgi:hypothetical protein
MQEKKKAGRKPINLDHNEIERLAGMGLNERQICASLGINPSTLTRKKHIKSIKHALEKGRASAIAKVSSQLFNNAMEGKETSAIFFLKNRDPDNWKDRNILETNHTINLSHVINSAKDRVGDASHTIKRLDEPISKGEISFSHRNDSQKEIKNNDSESLSPSKSKSES